MSTATLCQSQRVIVPCFLQPPYGRYDVFAGSQACSTSSGTRVEQSAQRRQPRELPFCTADASAALDHTALMESRLTIASSTNNHHRLLIGRASSYFWAESWELVKCQAPYPSSRELRDAALCCKAVRSSCWPKHLTVVSHEALVPVITSLGQSLTPGARQKSAAR